MVNNRRRLPSGPRLTDAVYVVGYEGCLVQVGNGIELEAVGFQVRTLPVAPLWCDLGFVPNSRGIEAAANLRPTGCFGPVMFFFD